MLNRVTFPLLLYLIFPLQAIFKILDSLIRIPLSIAVDSRTRTRQTLWSSFVEVAILCITIIGLGGYGV